MENEQHSTFDSNEMPSRVGRFNGSMKRVVVAAGLALGLAAGGYGIASAATSPGPSSSSTGPAGARWSSADRSGPGGGFFGRGPGTLGTVQSVSGNSFVVEMPGGSTVTVDVSGTTTYHEPGASSASLSDVKTGVHVGVTGSKSGNTVTATSVTILPNGFSGPGHGGPGGGFFERGPSGPPPAV
jgi:Domain of unknown function (DUF5666)